MRMALKWLVVVVGAILMSCGGSSSSPTPTVPTITIAPNPATVAPRGSLTFSATGGSGTGFTWALATSASGGSIDASTGVYTAGATGSVTDVVRVTDSRDQVATQEITVTAAVSVSPASASSAPYSTQVFTASGGSAAGWIWSITTNASGGAFIGATNTASVTYQVGSTPNGLDVLSVQDSLGNAATVNVTVGEMPIVIQKWTAPTTWGGTATSFWPDSDPNLVQHATFNGTSLVEHVAGLTWQTVGTTAPAQQIFSDLPAGPRYGAGPFSNDVVNPTEIRFYETTGDDSALDLTGDMLVCAVIKPDWNPGSPDGADPSVNGHERIIMAKGLQGNSGWVLMQRHTSFCFQWQDQEAALGSQMNWTVTGLPVFGSGGYPNNAGPLNPSYLVVCGGRDQSSNQILVAANSFVDTHNIITTIPGTDLMKLSTYPATIGGYANGDLNHVFNGRVYETAVWAEPATETNVQAKMAAVLGLALPTQPDGSTPVASYSRETEAPYPALNGLFFPTAGGAYHTAWRHQPRYDLTKGLLFGLQGLNRVSLPESFDKWTASAGADASGNINGRAAPGDSERSSADLVSIAAGANLSLTLSNFRIHPTGATGRTIDAVHGQIWIYPNSSSGTLRVRSDTATVPENKTFTTSVTGTLPAGTYYYRVTAVGSAGESAASAETSLTTTSAGGINIRWRAVAGATNYKIYGGTAGAEELIATVGAVTTYLDDGSVTTPSGAIPVATWTDRWDLGHQDIDLATLTAGQWNRVWITGLTNNGYQTAAGRATVYLENPGAATIDFWAWGMSLAQIGGGQTLPFDPGPTMYDTLNHPSIDPASGVYEVLTLPPVTISTASTGFCLSADAQPADGMAWNLIMDDPRTLIDWKSGDGKQTARLIVGGVDYASPGNFIFWVSNSDNPGTQEVIVTASSASFTAGTKYTLRACVSPAGLVEIYAGDTLISTTTKTLPWSVPDLRNDGHVTVGSDGYTPWHGYISKALVCTYTGFTTNPSSCQ